MPKFRLYLAGDKNKKSEEIVEKNNNFRLMSYLNESKHILARKEKGLKTFVDSGAYSAFTKGKVVDIDHYIGWLNEHDEGVEIAAELDVIPGKWGITKTQEELDSAAQKSWENYLYMIERLDNPRKLLPIYHQGEDYKYLEQILEYKPNIDYIGISPSNEESTQNKKIWIHEVFEIIKASSNPDVKTHAFGMTALHVLEQYPFTSADSTSWKMVGIHGSIMTPFGTVLMSEQQKKHKKHFYHMPELAKKRIGEFVESMGYTVEEMMEDYSLRECLNANYLTAWTKGYKYSPAKVEQTKLF